MKIALNKDDKKILYSYFEQNSRNFLVSNQYNSFLSDSYDAFTSDDVKKARCDGSDEETALASLFYSFTGYEEEEDTDGLIQHCDFGHFRILDEKEFLENSYLKTVHFKDCQMKDSHLLHNYYAPYELFPYQETETKENYCEISPIGFFRKKVPYIVLTDRNYQVWMSITPYEINTMKKAIDEAEGDVLTFGLGLGYFAFMAAKKKEVRSVTVVEKDPSVISLFKDKILPSIPEKEKIKIVKDDAFRRFRDCEKYDDTFIDIYRAAEDALPLYLRFRKQEEALHLSRPVSYWIESSIFALMRRYLLSFLEEQSENKGEEFYRDDPSDEGKLMYRIYLRFKDTEITSIEEIDSLLTDQGLRALAAEL